MTYRYRVKITGTNELWSIQKEVERFEDLPPEVARYIALIDATDDGYVSSMGWKAVMPSSTYTCFQIGHPYIYYLTPPEYTPFL